MHQPSNYKHVTRTSKKKRETEESPARFAQNLLKSLLITFAAGAVLTVAGSLVAYFSADPNVLILPLSLVAAALTALVGGFAAARINGSAAMLSGLINGTAMMAIMILASLFFKHDTSGYSAIVSLLLHAAFLLLSAIGGLLGQKRAKPRRRKR